MLFSRFSRSAQPANTSRGTQPADSSTDTPTFTSEETPWLVIGLGNPGAKYEATRHNVGYMAVDALLDRHEGALQPLRGIKAQAAGITIGKHPVLLVRSTTFMNNSGEAVEGVANAYDIPAEKVIVLHDELDLPHGKVRLKMGGNENGHNGLKSTSELLGTRDYLRVRMGIGRPPKGGAVIDHVLGAVESGQVLDAMVCNSADAVEELVCGGLSVAQNKIHSR